MVSSGIYSYLPLGYRVLNNINKIIRKHMNSNGAQELFMSVLQPIEIWQKTGRDKVLEEVMFKFKDRKDKTLCLGPTHEEEITDSFSRRIKLPLAVFQIQTKFRNEMRSTGGLLRTREFLMKDLYSFHADKKDLENFYQKAKKAYFEIFKKCGLKAICIEADPGTIGGDFSHEFMVLSPVGEDKVKGKNAIEIGHIFNLGTKYSKAMSLPKQVIMGCYGIGLPRLMATIVEEHHDEKGIIWPKEVAPFQIHLIKIENNQKVKKAAEKVYQDLKDSEIEVLYDDRADKSAGEKFAEADLIGIPWRIVISERTLKVDCAEMKKREDKAIKLVKIRNLVSQLRN